MSKEISKSINLKVTEQEKAQLDRMAQARNQTLKDIILNGTVYSKEHETMAELLQLKEDLADLEEVKQQQQGLHHETQRLEALLSAKDETITVLEDQLEIANKRLDDSEKKLDQAHSLAMVAQNNLSNVQLKLETIEEDQKEVKGNTERKGFFSRIFGGK